MSKLPIHRAAAPKIKDKISRGIKQLPEVEIIRTWRGYPVGARIRPVGVLRQVLMSQKIAVMVADIPKDPPPKKRGRPKKVKEAEIPVVDNLDSDHEADD